MPVSSQLQPRFYDQLYLTQRNRPVLSRISVLILSGSLYLPVIFTTYILNISDLESLFKENFPNPRRKTLMKKLLPLVCLVSQGVLPYKSLMGMCRWMGSHFHNWSDYYGVANFRILGVTRESKWEDSRLKRSESCLLNLTISLHGPAS